MKGVSQTMLDAFGEHALIDDGCWIWTGFINDNGYAMIFAESQRMMAHRFAYETWVGALLPWPEQTIDHLCRNRACVKPSHLEPTTISENVLRGEGLGAVNARKTHCLNGHTLEGKNLYLTPSGARNCKRCRADAAQRLRDRRRNNDS